jgi:hypothetical protein
MTTHRAARNKGIKKVAMTLMNSPPMIRMMAINKPKDTIRDVGDGSMRGTFPARGSQNDTGK